MGRPRTERGPLPSAPALLRGLVFQFLGERLDPSWTTFPMFSFLAFLFIFHIFSLNVCIVFTPIHPWKQETARP